MGKMSEMCCSFPDLPKNSFCTFPSLVCLGYFFLQSLSYHYSHCVCLQMHLRDGLR